MTPTDVTMVEFFLTLCARFLAGDSDLASSLHAHDFELIDAGWNFTLPQLHAFLASQISTADIKTYKEFRQQLFDSDINTRLALHGGVIIIAHNTGKVDLSIYRLQRA